MTGRPPNPSSFSPFMTTKQAATWLHLCARTLEKHRSFGTGPAYHKIGGRILYDIADLRAWVETGSRTSTSDKTGKRIPPAKPHAARSPAYRRRERRKGGSDE
ncbi:helix-turn-helix domain-containing protein [Brucella pseudogrignonensis]|uniref:helix-turn-helix transcriptional regulator n=1 Tax=Brucella pseudogrignonensis TaxID=419475 RepID=UPI001E4A74C4|nr:helix-turn-helix domain-containing protein [Brucella pseudogrignonensis]MCD4512187.1 helix-turn-helix domain-containing protein [Brucella pseudogrignonensis]